jgi:hypothetical protein|tara:strand:+ start:894 stop:1433 length:540 start_codon:yes stop_codon:yes gene_type:complete
MISEISKLSDIELTSNIKENKEVSGCLEELQNRHSGIFHQKARKFHSVMEVRDLEENPLTFFYEVAKEYKAEKGQFNTWLGNKTFWTCHNYMSRSKKTSEIHDWDGSQHFSSDMEEIYEYVKDNISNKEDRFILIKRLEGHTLKEIEALFDGKYSYEWVRQKYNRQINRFKKILIKEIY